MEMPTKRITVNAMDKVIKKCTCHILFRFYIWAHVSFPVTGFDQILPCPSNLSATVFIIKLQRGPSN